MFKNLKSKNIRNMIFGFFLNMLMPFLLAIHFVDSDGGGGEKELLDKIEKTFDQKSLDLLKKAKEDMIKAIDEVKAGTISKTDYDKKIAEINEVLKGIDLEKFKAYETRIADLEKTVKDDADTIKIQGEALNKMKEGGIPGNERNALKNELQRIVESPEFRDWVETKGKKKVEFELKAPISMTSDYTGSSRVHVTTRDGRVVDHPEVVRLNVRDLLTVAPTDLPYLAFIEIYDWNRAVAAVGENTSLPESTFKVRESVVDAKRIGTHVLISKRMLRSVTYVVNHLAVRLPAQVRYNEDFQLLFGDGQGNNVTGIWNVADDFADLINASITGVATKVTSIASYDDDAKTLVTFAENFNINNGDKITFASTDDGTYDNTYSAIVISPTKIVIEQAYTPDATVAAAWTFAVNSSLKDAIAAAQEIDVLKSGRALINQQEYSCNGIVLNPIDAAKIDMLKGNDEHYLEVSRDGGILRIAGVPVVETTAMPQGKFQMGDFALAAALYEFTSLILEFSESTNEKLTNSVMAIVQEEILFPIYNKYMFVKGDFATAIPAITAS